MRIARVLRNSSIYLAPIEGDHAILLFEESSDPSAATLREALAAGADLNGEGFSAALETLQLLSPVAHPGKFLAIGQNYFDHAHESGAEAPIAPIAFTKVVTSIIGPDNVISYHNDQSTQVDYEAELALVISRRARDVSEMEAAACIDVSARDQASVENGDLEEVEVEGIGRLRNSVRVDPDLPREPEVHNMQVAGMEGA